MARTYFPPGEQVLKRGQAARMLGVGAATVAAWSRAGKLDSHLSPGGQKLYREADVRALADALEAPAADVRAVTQAAPVTREPAGSGGLRGLTTAEVLAARQRDELAWAAREAAVTPAPRRIVMLSDEAEHQIRLSIDAASQIAVSCACRARSGLGPLEARSRWEDDEHQAVYLAHLAEAGAS